MVSVRKILVYVAAAIVGLYSILPIYSLVIISLMDVRDVVAGNVFPVNPNINAYLRIFGFDVVGPYGPLRAYGGYEGLMRGLTNIMIVAPTVMAITIIAVVPAAYALGRLRVRGRSALVLTLLASRSLPQCQSLSPTSSSSPNLD